MKKTALLLVLALTTLFTNAQFKKADKFVEGSASYSKAEGSDAVYNLQPTVGYFTSDKLAFGIFGQIGKDQGRETTGFGAFGRYYVLNVGQNLKTYSQLTVGNTSIEEAGINTSTFGIDLGLGVNYFISKRLALSLDVANLMTWTSQESNSEFSIGWNGVTNPFSVTKFGVLYRF